MCGRVAPTHADAAPGSRVQGPGRSGGASGAGGVQVVLDCWWCAVGVLLAGCVKLLGITSAADRDDHFVVHMPHPDIWDASTTSY